MKVKISDYSVFEGLFTQKSLRVFNIDGKKVCVAKFQEDFFAFDYLCPHQNEPLKNAKVTAFQEVVCPLHSYRFSLKDGREANQKCRDLKVYQLTINTEGVYLTL